MMNAVLKTHPSAAYPSGVTGADHTPRVVVVDDSRASLAMTSRSIADLDLDVRSFESPREGFAYLSTHPADLIFLGNLMRETDGMTLLRRLRATALHAHTSVVIMSTKDYDQDRDMARELGAVAYLVKPVPTTVIRDVINQYTATHVIV